MHLLEIAEPLHVTCVFSLENIKCESNTRLDQAETKQTGDTEYSKAEQNMMGSKHRKKMTQSRV